MILCAHDACLGVYICLLHALVPRHDAFIADATMRMHALHDALGLSHGSWSLSLRAYAGIPENAGTSDTIHTQAELQTASPLADRAGRGCLYAFSQQYAWTDCRT